VSGEPQPSIVINSETAETGCTMIYESLLYTSLILFGLGIIYKVHTWFSRKVGIWAEAVPYNVRVARVLKGIFQTLFSSEILILLKTFLFDVLFQVRTFRQSRLRWFMHMLIFIGFVGLLLLHALGEIILSPIFEKYVATLNPYFFLRDFFGLMVLAALAIAVYRRYVSERKRLKTNGMDLYAILILAVIVFSGILLIGLKITSYETFESMVDDYAPIGDEERNALEALWVSEFGLVSPNTALLFDEETLETGREITDMNCVECHVSAKWSALGFSVAKILKPLAQALDAAGGVGIVWYVHILACFFGLAYLPFSKMFHIIATPISLLANAVMADTEVGGPAVSTRQALELDACTHCGTCNFYCSAMMACDALGNEWILPSEKMAYLKRLAREKPVSSHALDAIREGVYLCTNCDRCTVVCPSGIRLKELWVSVREDLIRRGAPEPLMLSPLSLLRGLRRNTHDADTYPEPLVTAQHAAAGNFSALTDKASVLSIGEKAPDPVAFDATFSQCFGCQICTTVCPVVGSFENPRDALGLLPHQLMCALALGQTEMAAGARMIWECVTCYQCQEHCPQKVQVTEILYGLKNMAVKRVRGL